MLQQIINFCEVISEIRKNELSAHISSKEFKANYSYHWSVSYSSKDEMIVLLIWSKTKKIKIDASQLDCIYLFALAASKLLDEETSSSMISYYDDVLLEMRKIGGIIPTLSKFDAMSKYEYFLKFHTQNKYDWEILLCPTKHSSSNMSFSITPSRKNDSEALSNLLELLESFWKCYQNKGNFDINVIFISQLFMYTDKFEITRHQNY